MEFIVKSWNELTIRELYEILKARAEIFIVEQQINYQDMDDIDYESIHCYLVEDGKVIAYLRAFYEDKEQGIVKLGRVLTLFHGKGFGKQLLEQSLSIIKRRMYCQKVYIHAQKQAQGFYEKFGFQIVSDEFLEDGILHIAMELDLSMESQQ